MNINNQQLVDNIMWRVRTIYYMRRLASPFVIKLGVLLASGLVVSFSISIPHIVDNVGHLSYFSEGMSYLLNAGLHTKLLVQAGVGLSAAVLVWMAADAYKSVRFGKANLVEPATQ